MSAKLKVDTAEGVSTRWRDCTVIIIQEVYGRVTESLNSLQKAEVGISKEDVVGGVVDGQSTGPLQLARYEGADIVSVHANSADICCVTPVGPVKPSGGEGKKKE